MNRMRQSELKYRFGWMVEVYPPGGKDTEPHLFIFAESIPNAESIVDKLRDEGFEFPDPPYWVL